jgi:alpha-amylase
MAGQRCAWTTFDESPHCDVSGMITDTDCSSRAWECVDRNQAVARMVGWHTYVDATPVTTGGTTGET